MLPIVPVEAIMTSNLWRDAASAKREVHEGSEFQHAPDLTVKPFNLSQSQRERKVRNKNGKCRGEKRQ